MSPLFLLLAGCGSLQFFVHDDEATPPRPPSTDDTAIVGADDDSADPDPTDTANTGGDDSADPNDSGDSGGGDTATPTGDWTPGEVTKVFEVPYSPGEFDLIPRRLHLGDVNGDGHLDLAYDSMSTDYWSWAPLAEDPRTATVLQGDGAGGLYPFDLYTQTSISYGNPNGSMGDINSDGLADLVVGTEDGILLLQGSPTGFVPIPIAESVIVEVQLIDWDGDGDLDLFTSDADHVIHLRQGDGTGNFTLTTTLTLSVSWPGTAYGIFWAFADVNGDGKVDLVTDGSDWAQEPVYYLNDGLGGLSSTATAILTPDPLYDELYFPQVVEADGDAAAEILYPYFQDPVTGYPTPVVWDPDTNAINWSVSPPVWIYPHDLVGLDQTFAADLNQDGANDILRFVVTHDSAGLVYGWLLTSLANGAGFDPWVETLVPDLYPTNAGIEEGINFAVGDLDEDACQDIIVNAEGLVYLIRGAC